MPTAVIYDKWLAGLGGGEVVACTMARILKDNGYGVLFLSKDSVSVERIKNTLGIDLSDIAFKQVSNESDLRLSTNDYRPLTIDLFINISFMDYSYGIGKRNIYYVHFPSMIRSGLFNYVLMFFEKTQLHTLFPRMFRERVEDRLKAGIYPNMQKRLDSYDTFICHSEFVKGWIKKMWNKEAIVLYPPVKLLMTNDKLQMTKKNWIVSVGRFFTLGHGKKQEILIEAFKKLYSELTTSHQSLATDLQLHLIGGIGKEPSSLRYVEQLKEMAKGYPIFFHFDVKREEVEKILQQSKIYWHAGGYWETNPINLEHFGIAPVEAISAECIPILFNGGGLVEIIEKLGLDPNLHLFNTVDALTDNTIKVILQKEDMTIIQRRLNTYFSKQVFVDLFMKKVQENHT